MTREIARSPDDRSQHINGSSSRGFGSAHVGGAQFLLADGAVRFISESIDLTTYGWLAHRRDGAVIGEF